MPDWVQEIETLRRRGVSLTTGLTPREIKVAEGRLNVRFPVDLAEFLSTVLPSGKDFPNWRKLHDAKLNEQLAWPVDGILFDVQYNSFWWEEWGYRPSTLEDAIALARRKLAAQPLLLPVYGHRYLPADPPAAGNPVLSVYQTDIIYYGADLRRYIAHEFGGIDHTSAIAGPIRRIRFWSDVIEAG